MNKYWYFTANVFTEDQKGLFCLNNGTTIGENFPLTDVVSQTARKVGVPPNSVAITFFSEISCEEYESYNKLKGLDK